MKPAAEHFAWWKMQATGDDASLLSPRSSIIDAELPS
jgi:hypothetical protein